VAFENFFTVQEATAGAERHINGGATLRMRLPRQTLIPVNFLFHVTQRITESNKKLGFNKLRVIGA